MIVEIEKPRDSVVPALDYNEGKVLRGVAELVGYANMESAAREDIYALLSRYEKSSRYPTRERSFHASVNPSGTDDCSEEDVLAFIAEMMDALGYRAQPYLVYRHFDIERVHYHVVSVRIGKDGRKINNYYEKRRTLEFMKKVARRFGFSTVERGERVRVADSLTDESAAAAPLRFDAGRGVSAQMKALYEKALSYDFDSFAQLSCILEDLGLKASLVTTEEGPQLALQGLDRKGNPATDYFGERDLGEPLYARMKEAAAPAPARHRRRYREKERLRSLAGFAFSLSRSEDHFANILRNKGIRVHLSRTKESGDVFGVTFVDHATRTVFKASEIRDVVSVRMMREALASGKWRAGERGRDRGAYIRESRLSARADALRLRDLHAGVVARVLRPVGQPKGASWSGKARPTEDQRRLRREAGSTGGMAGGFGDMRFVEVIS